MATIKKESFGKLSDGRAVELYTLRNTKGTEVKVTTYGARLVAWSAFGKDHKRTDIVLGYADGAAYEKDDTSMGGLVGRHANRIAGGKLYCHINAAGDVEPCVFIHYSGANIREKSFLECLQQPLFKEYRKGQPFNNNHLRPCPMLENPEYLPQMVARSGAHSTDLEAPESVEHLCNKCESYAACWRPEAEKLWDEEHHD